MTATGADATQDYRNGFNTFGYITEIDPFDRHSARKTHGTRSFCTRKACVCPSIDKPVVFYMGDDARGEYIYKFVSRHDGPMNIGGLNGDKYQMKARCMWRCFTKMVAASGGHWSMDKMDLMRPMLSCPRWAR